MKQIIAILSIFLFFTACGRVSDGSSSSTPSVDTSGNQTVSGGEITFDIRSTSQLVGSDGNSYTNKGHYNMLVQANDKNSKPLGGLSGSDASLYENNAENKSDEATVNIYSDVRSTTNQILLLLDFSGSLINDCDNVSVVSENTDNLCYQLVESAKKFVDDVVDEQQTMAIYYFNSKTEITALVTSNTASATTDKVALKNGLNQLYNSAFREENLAGYDSTNLHGAVIEATKEACSWVGQCNYGNYTPQDDNNLQSFDFASIVVFTDGQDLAKRVTKQEMISFIGDHKTLYYYTIGLGDVDEEVLKSIGGEENYIPVSKNSDLNGAFTSLSTQLSAWGNSFYKVDYCPAAQEGNVDIKIKVTNDQYTGVITDRITLPTNIDFRCDL